MTDSLDKKSNDKRFYTGINHFDAEIDAAPLTDISDEEDAIDRLLIDTGFDQDDENDLFSHRPEISVLNEESTTFSTLNESASSLSADAQNYFRTRLSGAKETASQNHREPTDTVSDQIKISSSGIYTPFNKEAIDDSVNSKPGDSSMKDKSPQENIPIADFLKQNKIRKESLFKKTGPELRNDPVQENSAIGVDKNTPPLNHTKAATTDTNDLRQLILLINLESRTKKAILLSYAAISTASVAIIAAIALTFNAYRIQMNISTLSDTVKFFKGVKAKSLNTEIHKINLPQEIKTNVESNTIKSSREVVWYLNLVSFKDLNDAKLKSVEFMKKGIRTEINKVKVDNENWYRLRVGGFTSREQANGYAKKIEKTLHLSAMWIADS